MGSEGTGHSASHACARSRVFCRTEQITDWDGVDEFRSYVEKLGGGEVFPHLARMLSYGVNVNLSARIATAALEELDWFVVKYQIIEGAIPPIANRIRNLLLDSVKTESRITWSWIML